MDFIFMLTHHDRTVSNCLEVFEEIADLGLGHIGFKDVGANQETLKELTRRIKDSGAISYVEVVSTSPETIRGSIRASATLGVDRVLGGKDVAFALRELAGTRTGYYPFPGLPREHPTKLFGGGDLVERDCREAMAAGCPGVDLLAFRAQDAAPLDLIRAARRGLGTEGYLIVAGSIDSRSRINEIRDAGADAFTIGSAIFENSFEPAVAGVREQCRAVLAAVEG
jgi:hypothetical protein